MIIDGKAKAAEIRQDVATRVKALGKPVKLVCVAVGNDPASQVYVRNKKKACVEAGIKCLVCEMGESSSTAQVLAAVKAFADDVTVHGILVQLPLPVHIDARHVLAAVPPEKDVDGFTPYSMGLLATGETGLRPCTPNGIMELLWPFGLAGKHCVIVGRSNIVGKPLALMLLQADATVTVCHSKTRDLASITRQADILISAVGRPSFITADMVREGAVVIDVGINRDENGKLCGDVDFAAVAEKASAITPVPGSVGPMTVAMLLKNTLLAAIYQKR